MKYLKGLSILFLGLWLVAGCNKRESTRPVVELPDSSRIKVEKIGENATFELVCWNIENYPKLGTTTVTDVTEIIRDLDVDVIAMEEIADTSAFRQLLNNLPEYAGIYSQDTYGSGSYQKTAVIYRKSMVTLLDHEQIFWGDSYSFPRPPLKVTLAAQRNGKTFDFNLIVLHLKASGGSENEARRRSAIQKLKNYLDTQIATGAEKDYIVVGDWNDVLNDPPSVNVFTALLNDSANYRFLTKELADNPQSNATYIGGSYRSVIDHIMISSDAETEYSGGLTRVIKIDESFNAYVNEVSDHRPVVAVFPVFVN